MNYESVLEGVRINASRGPVWVCSEKQGQMANYRPTRLFREILETTYGFSAGNRWIREYIRLPFLNYLFAEADYGGYMREVLIISGHDLTSGEAMALHEFLYSDEAREVLAEWLHDQAETGTIKIPCTKTLWERP